MKRHRPTVAAERGAAPENTAAAKYSFTWSGYASIEFFEASVEEASILRTGCYAAERRRHRCQPSQVEAERRSPVDIASRAGEEWTFRCDCRCRPGTAGAAPSRELRRLSLLAPYSRLVGT